MIILPHFSSSLHGIDIQTMLVESDHRIFMESVFTMIDGSVE